MEIQLVQAEVTDRGARPLLLALDAEYRARYGDLTDGELEAYPPEEFRPPRGAFLLALAGGETVAGGALRRWADGIGEIKRMWTSPRHRRRGLGRGVLEALEEAARGYGYHSVRLETASLQDGAIGLYEAAGYHRIAGYGRYAVDPRFVYFEKRLAPAQ